jgi:hypothetical protein
MTTLRIYDIGDGEVLALDLRHLFDLLAPRSLEASWKVSPVRVEYPTLGRSFDEFMVTGKGGDQLERLAASGMLVSGPALAEYAHGTPQVIWGQFVATHHEQTGTWVVIRAIDSTFYEVTTSDDMVLAKIRSTYKDVRVASGPVASAPIPRVPREGTRRMYQIDWFRDGEKVSKWALHADDEQDAIARVEAKCAVHPEVDFPRDGTTARVLLINFPYNPEDYA